MHTCTLMVISKFEFQFRMNYFSIIYFIKLNQKSNYVSILKTITRPGPFEVICLLSHEWTMLLGWHQYSPKLSHESNLPAITTHPHHLSLLCYHICIFPIYNFTGSKSLSLGLPIGFFLFDSTAICMRYESTSSEFNIHRLESEI